MASLAPGATPIPVSRDALAEACVLLTYLWRHRRVPDLSSAPRFTEQVQRRKLYDRDPRHPPLMDKIASNTLAGERLGADWMTPTLWRGHALPDNTPFPAPAIVKARHGCNQYAVLRTSPTPAAWRALQARSRRWTAQAYGFWLSEWAYQDVPREVMAEPLIGGGAAELPLDYKIYVFGGVATHVQVHMGRAGKHRWVLHDRDFKPLMPGSERPARPGSLGAMLAAAEELGRGFDFLRIDFYEVDGRPRFGEFCLYPGSGLDPFAADWIDFELGALWHAALSPRAEARLAA